MVTALHFLPVGAMPERGRPVVVTLPAALQSVLLVAIVLVVGALLAGQPEGEAFLLLGAAALTAIGICGRRILSSAAQRLGRRRGAGGP